MSIGGLNTWNKNQHVREQMQNEALEYQLRENNPQQAKQDIISRISVRVVLLILALAALFLLLRGI